MMSLLSISEFNFSQIVIAVLFVSISQKDSNFLQ